MSKFFFVFCFFLSSYRIVSCLNCDSRTEFEAATCERTCSDAVNKNYICSKIAFPTACICKFGYGRHNGVCVPAHQCPGDTHFACEVLREKFHKCGNRRCEQNCTNLQLPMSCSAICNPPSYACICSDGFARNRHGVCVRHQQC